MNGLIDENSGDQEQKKVTRFVRQVLPTSSLQQVLSAAQVLF